MLLHALLDVVVLLIAFALGVIFGPAVKGVLGVVEEDWRVELGLMRQDVSRLTQSVEKRLAEVEQRLNK